MLIHSTGPSGSGTLTACGAHLTTDAIAEHGERVTCVACLKAIEEHQERSAEQPPPPPTTVTQSWSSQKSEPFCEYPLPHLPQGHHYDAGGIPSIDVLRAKLTPDQYEGFLLANVIKYACRYNFKGEKRRDASKLADYSCWLVEHLGEGD
jgi:hypothetical protein